MNRVSTITFAVIACAGGLAAQPAPAGNPLIAETRQSYNSVKTNLTRMAEKMPEENYAFKPVPEIRSFGELVAHVADAQSRICGGLIGSTRQSNAGTKTAKADLVAALKASFDDCDAAMEKVSDANANEPGGMGGRSRLGTLVFNVVHDNEEYGYMSVYLRLKGVVPPSTADRPAMPAQKK